MEYATAQDRPAPVLGQLKYAAERAAKAAIAVEQFMTRFHGPQSTAADSAANGVQIPENYRNDIDSLLSQLDRLETAIGALESIG